MAPWYFVCSPRNYVNSKKHAFIKRNGDFFFTELVPRPIWSTILDVPLAYLSLPFLNFYFQWKKQVLVKNTRGSASEEEMPQKKMK